MVKLLPIKARAQQEEVITVVNRLVRMARGDAGGRINLQGDDGIDREHIGGTLITSGNYALRARSAAGNHLRLTHSSASPELLLVQDAGLTLANATVTGNATIGGTLGVTGAVTLSSTLTLSMLTAAGDMLYATNASGLMGRVVGVASANTVLHGGPVPAFSTVATADIAAGAVTQRATTGAFSGTRTAAGFADVHGTNGVVTLTTTGGDLLVIFTGSASNTNASVVQRAAVRVDSGADSGVIPAYSYPGAATFPMPFAAIALFTGVSAASHTVAARHSNDSASGTMTTSGTMIVIELKR